MTKHLCVDTDGDWTACIDGTIYGPCEYGEDPDDTGSCGGMCEIKGECSCSCHRPALTEETTCSTCGGAGEVRCLAHIAGDGCVDMVFACPDCLTEEGGQ